MPGGINGYQLAEQATKKYPKLKVLLASGYTKNTLAEKTQERFNDNLLVKPYSLSDLAQRVQSMLKQS